MSKYDFSDLAPMPSQTSTYDFSDLEPSPQSSTATIHNLPTISNPSIWDDLKNIFNYTPEQRKQILSQPALPDISREQVQKGLELTGIGLTPEIEAPVWLASKVTKPIANWLTSVSSGAAIGALSSDDRTKGAEEGAALSAIGYPLISSASKLAGLIKKGGLSNSILSVLNNGSSLSPEETAENLKNYTASSGAQFPVDIGTLTNNPTLKKVYSTLQKIPFSGAAKQANAVQKGLAQNDIDKAQSLVDQLENKNKINTDVASSLADKLSKMQQYKQKSDLMINQAPSFLNDLNDSKMGATDSATFFKSSLKDLERRNMGMSNENYAPINNSKIRLDQISNIDDFKNYVNAAHDIDIQRDALKNLFGTDKDLKQSVNSETNHALNFIKSGKNYAMTLPDALERVKTLKGLAASAKSEGNLREASLLSNLGTGLSQDIDNILRNNGHSDIADHLLQANQWHEQNVIPFRKNSEIRKAVYDKNYQPNSYKIAKALHDPNFQSILYQLPKNAQDASLFQLLTKGKYSSKGMANLTSQEIGNGFQSLSGAEREAIAKYNPLANDYLENLNSFHDQNKTIAENIKQLTQSLKEMNKAPEAKLLPKAHDSLQKALQKRFGVNQVSPSSSKITDTLKNIAALGAGGAATLFHPIGAGVSLLGGTLLSRKLAKELTNPDVIKAYISGEKTKNLSKSIPLNKLIAAALLQQNKKGDQ